MHEHLVFNIFKISHCSHEWNNEIIPAYPIPSVDEEGVYDIQSQLLTNDCCWESKNKQREKKRMSSGHLSFNIQMMLIGLSGIQKRTHEVRRVKFL